MTLKPCTGCKYLVLATRAQYCRQGEPVDYRTNLTDPLTGFPIYKPLQWRDTIQQARADDGKCGPEARLYVRGSWLRLFLRAIGLH